MGFNSKHTPSVIVVNDYSFEQQIIPYNFLSPPRIVRLEPCAGQILCSMRIQLNQLNQLSAR